jgi:hypothetical protein
MDDFDKFWIGNPTVRFGQGWGDFASVVMGFRGSNTEKKISGFSLLPVYLPDAPLVVAYYEVVDVFGGLSGSPHIRGLRFTRVNGKDPGPTIRQAMAGHRPYFDLDSASQSAYSQSAVNMVATKAMSEFQRLEAYSPFIYNGQVVVDRFRLFHAEDALGSGTPMTLLIANIVAANSLQQQDGAASGPPRV